MNNTANKMRQGLRGTGMRPYLIEYTVLAFTDEPDSPREYKHEPQAAPSAEQCAELVPTLAWWKRLVQQGFEPVLEQIWCAPGS